LSHVQTTGAQAARSHPRFAGFRFCAVPPAWLHKQFRHPDGRGTTVADHGGRDIGPPMLRQIAKDIGLTWEEFIEHL